MAEHDPSRLPCINLDGRPAAAVGTWHRNPATLGRYPSCWALYCQACTVFNAAWPDFQFVYLTPGQRRAHPDDHDPAPDFDPDHDIVTTRTYHP
jgi:hypothetical protein